MHRDQCRAPTITVNATMDRCTASVSKEKRHEGEKTQRKRDTKEKRSEDDET
jgi:hypothetical protein